MQDVTYAGPDDRLDRVVAAAAGISRTAARALLAAGAVCLNDRPCRIASRLVRAGDRVRVSAPVAPAAMPTEPAAVPAAALPILFEADGVIAIDKPAGMPSSPTRQGAAGTAQHALAAQLAQRDGRAPRLWVVHRLDTATSGVLAFATTRAAAAALSRAFHDQQVAKRYVAVVAGVPAAAEGRIALPLAARGGRAVVAPHGRAAETIWRLVERTADRARLALEPRTGRLHQLRAHLAAIGHPIVGDPVYGGPPHARLLLHATHLALPWRERTITIESPPPF